MIKKDQNEVTAEKAPMPGAKEAYIQWLIAKPQGADNFFMRRIILKEGGHIPDHSHPEEHEIYILTGQGKVTSNGESVGVKPGDFIFVPGGEVHSFTNTGSEELTFICCINNTAKE